MNINSLDKRAMSLPVARFNTFFKENDKENLSIDAVSKVYIIFEVFFGLNRVPLLRKTKACTIVSVLYSFIIGGAIFFLTILLDRFKNNLFAYLTITIYLAKITHAFIFYKQFEQIFNGLEKIDDLANCTPKRNSGPLTNSIKYCFIGIIFELIFFFIDLFDNAILLLPTNMVHILDLNFYGHLFNLLIPRIRFINFYMEDSIKKMTLEKRVKLEEFQFQSKSNVEREVDMGKLMDCYITIIDVHERIIVAIKWQILVMLITMFIVLLWLTFNIVLNVISGQSTWLDMLRYLLIWATLAIPLFSPCVCVDNLQAEVRILRKFIAARLFEHNLDKYNRSIARAFLALTSTKDLSFNLFHMLPINISLPFQFIGLLLTYLIILLQFEKVIRT